MTPGPTVTAQATEAEVDRSTLKIVLLALFGIGSSVLATKLFLNFLLSVRTDFFFLWLIAAAVFLVFVLLETIFIKSRMKLVGITFLQGIVPLALFANELYPNPSTPLFVGAGLFSLFLIFGSHKGWRFLQESLTIRFSFMAKIVLPKVVMGMIFFLLSVLYVQYFQLNKFTDQLGESILSEALTASEPLVKLWFPGVQFDQNVGSFFGSVAESQVKNTRVEMTRNDGARVLTEFQSLTDDMKKRIIDETGNKVRMLGEEKLKIPLSPDLSMKKAIFLAIKKYIENSAESMGVLFHVIVLAIVFFTLKGIFSLIHWFISFLAFVIYKFLVAVGFAYINLENRSREFVLLS
jgi:hypothetical protein